MTTIQRVPSPTQDLFIQSESIITVLVGPEGEGKTWAGIYALAEHARKFFSGRTLRAAIIRDTFENIKDKTVESIIDATDGEAKFWDGNHQMQFKNVHAYLFGIADDGALNKLQGSEYGAIWLEEPAPMQSRSNAGLRESVFNRSLYRCTRQSGGRPRLLISMNPADEDHWTYKRLIERPIMAGENEDYPDVSTEVFYMQPGENEAIKDITRQAAMAAYKDNPAEYRRYVEGKFAFVTIGEKVTPEYNEQQHRSDFPIAAEKDLETFRFWDGGLNPTCTILQITPRGHITGLDTLRGENIGMRQLIRGQLKPLLARHYQGVEDWRDIGDPALKTREQSDSSKDAAKVIEEELGTMFEPGESSWQKRTLALSDLFNTSIDGVPMFCLSSTDLIMHRALRGGWHYKVDNNGTVIRDKPVKDLHSHPGDALSHGIAKLLARPEENRKLQQLREHRERLLEKRQERFSRMRTGREHRLGTGL